MSDLDRLRAELERHRRELLDLSARNRLIHASPSKVAKAVRVVDERSDEVWRTLVGEGKAMSFLPRPASAADRENDAEAEAADDLPFMPPPDEDDLPTARHSDTRLQTWLKPEVLQRRLLGLALDTRTQEEETGANPLFLALGMLRWYESDSSDKVRTAPLILLPVEIDRSDARHAFRLKALDEDVATNLSLQARLKQDFGVTLPDIPDRDSLPEGWRPSDYFAAVEAAVARQPRWSVARDEMLLWLFSFTRFLMYRDLDPATWPGESPLAGKPLVSGLLCGGFRGEPPLFADGERLDAMLPPKDLPHVVDADSSQAAVVEEVRRGRNLVVQGPPGTGKSQTIVNVIAAAVRDGKSVLFVAEKQAALDVVLRRLEKVGLGPLCLGLHSHAANKKEVLAELERTLALSPPPRPDVDGVSRSLSEARDRLNRHAELLHKTIKPAGLSVFKILGELARLRESGVEPAGFTFPDAIRWEPGDVRCKAALLRDAANLTELLGTPPGRHPWRGVGLPAVPLPSERQAVAALLGRLCPAVEGLAVAATELNDRLGLGLAEPLAVADLARLAERAETLLAAPDVDPEAAARPVWRGRAEQVAKLVEAGRTLAASRAAVEGRVADVAWETDLGPTRVALAAHGRSWLRWLSGDYRRACATLRGLLASEPPKPLEERLALVDALVKGQKAAKALATPAAASLGAEAFGTRWAGEESDWDKLAAAAAWRAEVRALDLPADAVLALGRPEDRARGGEIVASIRSALEPTLRDLADLAGRLTLEVQECFGVDAAGAVSLAEWIDRLGRWRDDPDGVSAWINYRVRRDELASAELAEFAARLDDGTLPPGDAADQFRLAYFEGLLAAVRKAAGTKPEWKELVSFAGPLHDRTVAEFRRLDQTRIGVARDEVRRVHYGRVREADSAAGINVVRREMKKKQRHVPIRKLLCEAGEAVRRLKPVFLMSPMSVAKFLTPGKLEFDLLLIDEASQVRPEDALGSVARARQIVVVGDDKQLPPTDFFRSSDSNVSEDEAEDAETGDLESILGLCTAQGLGSRMLSWHYRSRHESLIAVSNHEFYDDKLLIVPGPEKGEQFGLSLRHVENGVYDRGRSQTNRVEARAVAEAVIAHALEHGTPDSEAGGKSLGVATFSVAQADAVTAELELLRREHPETEKFFAAGGAERFFVKNLENVQGDERDVMFVSVGYGKDANGYFARSFGPLNRSGGERRLNVLMTRARERCVLFSSIDDRDLDLTGISARGPHVLKEFLRYARTGFLDAGSETGRDPDSVFEEQVARAVSRLGYKVVPQVGVAGFRIDLAVVDPDRPGRYLLGIECDGSRYHSARWARDRDRLRQAVLESRGWTIHRVWSLDWFAQPQKELEKIRERLEGLWTPHFAAAPVDGSEYEPRTDAAEPVDGGAAVPS